MANRVIYQIGFYRNDGCFSVLSSRNKFHNWFPTYEMAKERCEELQAKYKHKLEPKKI